jgi:hypothetical protein
LRHLFFGFSQLVIFFPTGIFAAAA